MLEEDNVEEVKVQGGEGSQWRRLEEEEKVRARRTLQHFIRWSESRSKNSLTTVEAKSLRWRDEVSEIAITLSFELGILSHKIWHIPCLTLISFRQKIYNK